MSSFEITISLLFAADALRLLRAMGKQVLFVTNNSTRLRAAYAERFSRLGFDGVGGADVMTSAHAVALRLRSSFASVHRVFMIGSRALQQELEDAGYGKCPWRGHVDQRGLMGSFTSGFPSSEVVTSAEMPRITSDADFASVVVDPGVGAVVVGADFGLTYGKIAYASLFLQKNKGCAFLCTSMDAFDVLGDRRIPGAPMIAVGALQNTNVATVCGRSMSGICGDVLVAHVLHAVRRHRWH